MADEAEGLRTLSLRGYDPDAARAVVDAARAYNAHAQEVMDALCYCFPLYAFVATGWQVVEHTATALEGAWYELRAIDAQKELLDRTIEAYQKAFELTQNRYAGGIVSRADVLQAETQLKTVRAQAIDLGGHLDRAALEPVVGLRGVVVADKVVIGGAERSQPHEQGGQPAGIPGPTGHRQAGQAL